MGSVSENDRLKPCDVEVAGHSTNVYQLARSVSVKMSSSFSSGVCWRGIRGPGVKERFTDKQKPA